MKHTSRVNWKTVCALPMIALATSTLSEAAVIDFEDIVLTPSSAIAASFNTLNIDDTYRGFDWGWGSTSLFANAVFSAPNLQYWAAINYANYAPIGPYPANIGQTGDMVGFGWQGYYWINFLAPVTFLSADLAVMPYNGAINGASASMPSLGTIRGYDSSGNLVGTVSQAITTSFVALNSVFSGAIQYLQFSAQANAPGALPAYQAFFVDRIVYATDSPTNAVPEPAMPILLGIGLLTMAWINRRTLNNEREDNHVLRT